MSIVDLKTSRRRFLAGSGVAAASTVALNVRKPRLAFATPGDPSRGDAIVVVYLRFGADGLSMAPPIGSAYDSYRALRPTEFITPDQALPLDSSNPNAAFPQGLSGTIGLHPKFTGLYNSVWASGQLAVLPASGMPDHESDSRSHFQAQWNMEIGAANPDIRSGWLTRVMAGQAPSAPVGGVTTTSSAPTIFRGSVDSFSVANLSSFGLAGFRNTDAAVGAINLLHQGSPQINQLGRATLSGASALGAVDSGGGSGYPAGNFGADLRDVANILRADVGLTTALIDFPAGWDYHSNQGTLGGRFDNQIVGLDAGLTAFIADLGDAFNETTIMVISEFGRIHSQRSYSIVRLRAACRHLARPANG